MSVYLVKGKGWRYDFKLKGERHTEAWFKTKTAAKQAEAKRREAINNPQPAEQIEQNVTVHRMDQETPTGITFLELVNRRLDHVKAYNSERHYTDYTYMARRWVKRWGKLECDRLTPDMIEKFILVRAKVSAHVANKEIRYLRAVFNFGIKKQIVASNPTHGLEFLPIEMRRKYIPPKSDVMKVIAAADPDTQDYLWTIVLTAARVGEVNALKWDDVNFDNRCVTLWTRKKKGGNRESRDIPMVSKLYGIMLNRFNTRHAEIPWVFWHRYWSRKQGKMVVGPFGDRKMMKGLCDHAGVRYFRFHPLRHLTASILDDLGVPIGSIQRILGHENRRTTEIYLHSVGEAERKAMDMLEGVDIFAMPVERKPGQPVNVPKEFWRRKVERPDHDTLLQEVKELGYVGTGRKYGVSDTTIRKWIQQYERQEVSA